MPPTERCPFSSTRPSRGGLGDEPRVELGRGEPPRDVHRAARVRRRVAAVEAAGRVDPLVQQRGLLAVAGLLRREAADLVAEPPGDERHDVDREHGRRVEHRAVLGVRAVVEHPRQAVGDPGQEVLAHDRHRHPGGTGVLLGARVQETVAGHRHRPGEEVARGVADEDGRVRLGAARPLDALDRLVRRDVQVCRRRRWPRALPPAAPGRSPRRDRPIVRPRTRAGRPRRGPSRPTTRSPRTRRLRGSSAPSRTACWPRPAGTAPDGRRAPRGGRGCWPRPRRSRPRTRRSGG